MTETSKTSGRICGICGSDFPENARICLACGTRTGTLGFIKEVGTPIALVIGLLSTIGGLMSQFHRTLFPDRAVLIASIEVDSSAERKDPFAVSSYKITIANAGTVSATVSEVYCKRQLDSWGEDYAMVPKMPFLVPAESSASETLSGYRRNMELANKDQLRNAEELLAINEGSTQDRK